MRPTASRRSFAALAAACCFSAVPPPRPALADTPQALLDLQRRIDEDRALEERLRSEAVQPNKFGTLGPPPPPPPPPKYETPGFNGQRGVDSFGRLAPEYEGDTRERYSNPYAARLAETSKQRPELLKPGKPDVPVYRDGYFSVKPKNLQCDEDGRNCKFTGASPSVQAPKPLTPIPYEQTAEYRRDLLDAENRRKRELNEARAAMSPEERRESIAAEKAEKAAKVASEAAARRAQQTRRADVLGGGLREDDATRASLDKADALRAALDAENRRKRELNEARAAMSPEERRESIAAEKEAASLARQQAYRASVAR